MGRRVFTTGTGVGGKDVVIMGAGTGGCLTQSGWEAMGAKMTLWHGTRMYLWEENLRRIPVPSTTGIPVLLLPV